jgi:hypothetical protein
MIMVPVRVVKKTDDGVMCRLGSEPSGEAPVEFVPSSCIKNMVEAEGSDLGVLVLDPEKTPADIRKAIGLP